MNKVDISKLYRGQKVKFRCGGESVISHYCTPEGGIFFEDHCYGQGIKYQNDGRLDRSDTYNNGDEIHPFDIIEIIPKPFDWDTVKTGDAFTHTYGNESTYWFVGWNPHDLHAKKMCLTKRVDKDGAYEYVQSVINYLTRAPEHDIHVPA